MPITLQTAASAPGVANNDFVFLLPSYANHRGALPSCGLIPIRDRNERLKDFSKLSGNREKFRNKMIGAEINKRS